MVRSITVRIGATAVCLLAQLPAAAQTAAPGNDYPTRPIRMIVPFAPGGASDFVARILQQRLGEALSQQIVVDNRSGAAGNVGVEAAGRANPDGYTLLFGNVGTMAINPSLIPQFAIRPLRDLAGITLVSDTPGALALHPSIPATTVKEFVAYAKARPSQLNYGSASVGSAQRLAFEYFMSKTGIKLVHVAYKAGAGGVTAGVLAGEVSATMTTVTAVLPHIKAGKLRALAVVAPQRISQLPETPTMIEVGFPELTLGSWAGLYAPVATPRAIVRKLHAATTRALSDSDVRNRLSSGGVELVTSKSPEDFTAFMKAQTEFWAHIVKETGATPD
ncbi:MAG: Bug family tripartite tricarboxylate transporter substrate binding protein [Burkholderiales bacterium]